MKGDYISETLKVISMIPLMLAILLCVFSQFFIFKGYLGEARGNYEKVNRRYFGPTDRIVKYAMKCFLIGTFLFSVIFFKQYVVIFLLPIPFLYIRYLMETNKRDNPQRGDRLTGHV